AAEAETENFHVAVEKRHRNEGDPQKLAGAPDGVQSYARHSAESWLVVEDVGKDTADDSKRFFVAEDGKGGTLADIKRANIVKTENVVSMAMGEQNCVQAFEARAKSLLTKI